MKTCIHTTYQKSLQRNFIIIWLIGAISFSVGLLLHKSGFETIGWALFGVFGISVFGGLLYLTYLHYHVRCPICNGETKTTKDSTQSKWMAICKHCQIEWDLQTGVGGD